MFKKRITKTDFIRTKQKVVSFGLSMNRSFTGFKEKHSKDFERAGLPSTKETIGTLYGDKQVLTSKGPTLFMGDLNTPKERKKALSGRSKRPSWGNGGSMFKY